MNLNEKNLEFQIQIWALIGPVIALATVSTLYFQGSAQNLTLSLAVLLGTLACWWWKTKGLLGSLAAITLLSSYQFINQTSDQPLWNVGISFAIALTFLITALSFEEVESIVEGIQSESSSRLKSLLKLDEKLDRVQSRLQEEKKNLLQIIKEREDEIQHQERLIDISREEILSSHRQTEELLKEISSIKAAHQKETELAGMNASEATQQEIEDLRIELTLTQDQLTIQTVQARKEIDQLKSELAQTKEQLLAQNEVEVNTLQSELLRAKEQLAAITAQSKADFDKLKSELAQAQNKLILQASQAQQELNAMQSRNAMLEAELVQSKERLLEQTELSKQETTALKTQLAATQEQLIAAASVPAAEAESRELRRINGMYQQLRIQFEEKSSLLDATRRELFVTQERLTRELMEQKERQYEGTDYEKELQRCLQELEAEQKELVRSHRQEVEQLQELISQMMCCA